MSITGETTDVGASEAVALARAMGLVRPERMSDIDLVEHVEKGLPLRSVASIADRLDPDDRALKYMIIPRSSYARLKAERKRLSREQSQRVYAMARVVTAAMALWKGNRAAAKRFLGRPHPLLAGRTPLDVATHSTTGADLVVELMNRARAGVAI